MHRNWKSRAMLIKRIVDENYEPHSQHGCLRDIYRRKVQQIYPMSEASFWRSMRYAIRRDGYIGIGSNRVMREKALLPDPSDKQLELQFNN